MNRKLVKIIDLTVIGAAILTVGLISGISFLVSKNEYDVYERQYNEDIAEIMRQNPALPAQVVVDDDFVTYDVNGEFISYHESSYRNVKTIRAMEANIYCPRKNNENVKIEQYQSISAFGLSLGAFDTAGGGSVTYSFLTESYGDADIDIILASAKWDPNIQGNSTTESLGNYIKVLFDDLEVNVDEISLICNDRNNWFEFHHVILHKCHLKKGLNTLKIETKAYGDDNHIMPNMKGIHIFTEATYAQSLSVNGDTMALISQNGKDYLSFSGSCSGYNASQLSMDLCYDLDPINQIPSDALSVRIRDNSFIMKIELDLLPHDRTLFSHFWLDGQLYNSGRPQGDILSVYFGDSDKVVQEFNGCRLMIKYGLMVIEFN